MKKIFLTFKIFSALLISFSAFNNSFAIVVDTGQTVTINSDLTVSTIRVHSGGTLLINPGVTLTIIEESSGFNELELYNGGKITGAGLLKTNCYDGHDIILAIWENSIFDVDFESDSGRAVFLNAYNENYISINKKITIDTGASMVYFGTSGLSRLTVRGNIMNNGNLGSSSGLIIFKGQTITNNDTINADIEIDTNCIINGNGAWTSVYLFINPYRTLSLGNNVSTSVRNLILQSNAKLNLNSFTLTIFDYAFYSYSDILMYESSMLSSGMLKTKGYTVRFNIDTTAKLYAPLLVDSGNALMGGLFGSRTIFDSSVTINNNASISSSGYEIIFKNDVTNNGYLVLSYCKFRGGNLVNDGNICGGLVDFESNFNFSGSGLWTCQSYLYIKPNKTVTLQSDVRIRISSFEIETDATLNTNGYSFILDNLDGSSGDLNVDSAATITGSGEVLTKGHPESFHVDIYNHYNSNFNAALRVSSGLLFLEDPSSLNGKTTINNLITVDSGARLANQSSGDTIISNVSIVNNGTLSGIYNLYGSSFINNGIVTSAFFIFSSGTTGISAQNFQGTGSFEHPSYCIIDNGATVNLNSDHQLFILQIDSGGTFDISNQTLKISGVTTEPITNNGSFITTGSTIEFNRQNSQYFPVNNINYNNVRINNTNGITLTGNVTLPALLTLSSGDLDLNGFIITLTPSATLVETPGNTVKGNNGYISTTRTLNSPVNLNVAGMGAVLTTSANLGTTEIRRGHLSAIILGNQSIQRYFDIIPTNNTGLNATLGFKFDNSELDTLKEDELGLYKSTNDGINYSYIGGTVDTANNQINVSGINDFSRWSASLSGVAIAANITLIIEGLLDANTLRLNSKDTVTAYLANSSSPFNFIDSAKSVVDSVNYTGAFLFSTAPSGFYYIVIKHRNGIETWSKSGGEEYNIGKVLNYNFPTSQSQAYGDNQKLISGLWCMYSGDVNNDGAIDLSDLGLIDNDSYNFAGGYVNTDVNGDAFVDLADLSIADNNALNFVVVMRP